MNKMKFGIYAITFNKKIASVFISRDITNAKLKFEAEIYKDPKPENFELRCLGMYSKEQKRIIPTDIFIQGGYEAVAYKRTVPEIKKILNIAERLENNEKTNNEEIIVRLFEGVKLDDKN